MAGETKLGEAQVPIRAKLDGLDKDLASARGRIEGVLSRVAGTFSKGVRQVGAIALGAGGAAVGAIVGVGAAVGKLAADAAPLESIGAAFAGVADAAGVGADKMLAALQRGSAGMTSNRDLMMSFNSAAQLVSVDFAKQLPDAMKYLGKVSAATGEDLGFLLDSLVKGVGRLSPMILDNLAIQVNATEANEAWAKSNGVLVKDMTKAQQQSALMAQVLEKLAENTASMPEATGTAAVGLAQLKATFQNVKDEVGLAFLPALNAIVGVVGQLAGRVLPWLSEALDKIGPVAELVGQVFTAFISKLLAGADPLDSLQVLLRTFFPAEVSEGIVEALRSVAEWIGTVVEVVSPFVEAAAQWIGKNVELKDVLIALGIAVAAVVLPALWGIIVAAAPVIAAVVALVAIVALLRAAWEGDFLGIRTFVLETIETIKAFWAENGEAILAKAREIWTSIVEAVSTALQTAWEFIQTIIAGLLAFWAEHGDAILAKADEIWTAIVAVFEWFAEIVAGVFDTFRSAFEGNWYEFGEKLRGVWDEIWSKIAAIGETVWGKIKDFFTNTDWGGIGRSILEGIAKGITAGVSAVADAAKSAARAALDAAKGFLGIHSPSVAFLKVGQNVGLGLARGLEDTGPVERAMGRLLKVPNLLGQVQPGNIGGLVGAGAGAGAGGPTYQIINHFGANSVRSEQDIHRLSELQEEALELRGIRRSID